MKTLRLSMLAACVSCAALLGGCATTSSFDPGTVGGIITNVISTGKIPSITPEIDAKVNAAVTQVQSITTTVCGFLPIASTVAGILATLAGAGAVEQTAASVAQSICNAVTKKGARRGGAAPRLYGVPIRGKFVR